MVCEDAMASTAPKVKHPYITARQGLCGGSPVILSATIGGEEHQWGARVARTDGAIDPATRQISAIAVVDDPYGAGADDGAPLAIGLYVNARIEGKPLARRNG